MFSAGGRRNKDAEARKTEIYISIKGLSCLKHVAERGGGTKEIESQALDTGKNREEIGNPIVETSKNRVDGGN